MEQLIEITIYKQTKNEHEQQDYLKQNTSI